MVDLQGCDRWMMPSIASWLLLWVHK